MENSPETLTPSLMQLLGKLPGGSILRQTVLDLASQVTLQVQQEIFAASLESFFESLERIGRRPLAAIFEQEENIKFTNDLLKVLAYACVAQDPLHEARERGRRAVEELLQQEGGCLSAEEVAKLLGVSRDAIAHRRKRAEVFTVCTTGGGYAFPAWQFMPDGSVLPGLLEIVDILDRQLMPPVSQLQFFLSRFVSLDDRRPLDLLKEGKIEQVKQEAEIVNEQGAA